MKIKLISVPSVMRSRIYRAQSRLSWWFHASSASYRERFWGHRLGCDVLKLHCFPPQKTILMQSAVDFFSTSFSYFTSTSYFGLLVFLPDLVGCMFCSCLSTFSPPSNRFTAGMKLFRDRGIALALLMKIYDRISIYCHHMT